jgi:hypothetical protein
MTHDRRDNTGVNLIQTRRIFFVAIPPLALVSISTFFLISQFSQNQLFHFDANGYQAIADQIRTGGGAFSIAGNDLRAYFYPALLSMVQLSGANLGLPFFVSTFILQTAVYGWIAFYLYRGVKERFGEGKAFTATLIMCLNPFVAPYLSVSLTDSLYTSMALALVFWAWFQFTKPNSRQIWPGFLFFSLALAIRPAAIWLLAILLVTLVFLIRSRIIWRPKEVLLSLISTSPVLWQSFVNFRSFGVFSPFPIQDLGGGQINGGLYFVKYSTWTGPGSPSNYYSSSRIIGEYDGSGLVWYLLNPVEATTLVFFKFVGAFDFDYLVPYANKEFTLSWITSTISFLVALIGLFLIFRHLAGKGNLSGLGPRWFPLLVLISWGSISMLSMLELRYSLPIVTFFAVCSVWLPGEFRNFGTRSKIFFFSYLAAGLAVFWPSALFVRSLALIG